MRSIPAPAVQVDAPSECVPDLVDDECDGRYWPLIIPELCVCPTAQSPRFDKVNARIRERLPGMYGSAIRSFDDLSPPKAPLRVPFGGRGRSAGRATM